MVSIVLNFCTSSIENPWSRYLLNIIVITIVIVQSLCYKYSIDWCCLKDVEHRQVMKPRFWIYNAPDRGIVRWPLTFLWPISMTPYLGFCASVHLTLCKGCVMWFFERKSNDVDCRIKHRLSGMEILNMCINAGRIFWGWFCSGLSMILILAKFI